MILVERLPPCTLENVYPSALPPPRKTSSVTCLTHPAIFKHHRQIAYPYIALPRSQPVHSQPDRQPRGTLGKDRRPRSGTNPLAVRPDRAPTWASVRTLLGEKTEPQTKHHLQACFFLSLPQLRARSNRVRCWPAQRLTGVAADVLVSSSRRLWATLVLTSRQAGRSRGSKLRCVMSTLIWTEG